MWQPTHLGEWRESGDLPDGMELVFDIGHFISALDEIVNDFDLVIFTRLKTLGIVKDEIIVVLSLRKFRYLCWICLYHVICFHVG